MSGSAKLWGHQAKVSYLFVAAAILLLSMLGGRELWTQEHRWADIVSGMFFRHDFLHPYLGENEYYDKPLLSYWLMAMLSWISGHISLWALRLPSALSGLLAIWSIYRIGTHLKDRSFGLLSGWLLLTTFYFIFWARTSSADMLNMAGALFAVSWYFDKKNQLGFFNYAVFFLVMALTALCKGLIGVVVPLLVILPDLLHQQQWKQHLRFSLVLGVVPGFIIYLLPFLISNHVGGAHYGESGLYQVYRENILRYFQPFDHKGPIYTYFIFLPVYLLPWAGFFIPAIFSLKSRWATMNWHSRWIVWSVFLLFMFFTLSGSRRNYYVLSIVPFAILLTADWIQSGSVRLHAWASKIAVIFFVVFLVNFNIVQPLYYSGGGIASFAETLKASVNQIQPWSAWQVTLLDAESKIGFYLQLSPETKNYSVVGPRNRQTVATLLQSWPLINQPKTRVIYITRKAYEPFLKEVFKKDFQWLEASPSLGERLLKIENPNAPVAFISLS